MKHLFTLIAVFIFSSIFVYAQEINLGPNTDEDPACVNCYNSTVTGHVASALGISTQATNNAAFASGYGSIASGEYSTAIGYNNTASGNYALGLGFNAQASGVYSIALGKYLNANAINTIVIGSGTFNVPFTNNTANSIYMGMNCSTPSISILPAAGTNTFGFVGVGTTSPQHALEVNGTIKGYGDILLPGGKIGIGTSLPEVELEVVGVTKTDALQITDNATEGYVFTCMSSSRGIGEWTDPIKLGLWQPDNNDIYYTAGNVGIGITDPASLLHVDGQVTAVNVVTEGLMLKTTTESGAILTSDANGNAKWTEPEVAGVWKRDNKNVYLDEPSTTFHVGINTDNPTGHLQFGDTWCFYDSESSKIISNNYMWDNTLGSVRIADGGAESIKFSNTGVLQFTTAEIGLAGYPIDYNYMEMDEEGWVSMGKIDPQVNLDIKGSTMCKVRLFNESNYNSEYWAYNSLESIGIGVDQQGYSHIYRNYSNPESLMTFNDQGQILIGNQPFTTQMNDYGLYVVDGIQTTDVKIAEVVNWSDFVFSDEYKLQNINEVKKYIQENNHLPGMPSEKEIKKDGYTVSEMDAMLLQKIEELTLYIIEQQNEIEQLKKAMESKN